MDKTISFATHNLQLYGSEYIAPNQTVSAIIHFIFSAAIVIYLVFYLIKYKQRDKSLIVLLSSALLLFIFSAIYHSLEPMTTLRDIFHRFDHIGIALLFSALIYMLHSKYTYKVWAHKVFVLTIAFLSVAIIIKLFYFNFFLGWKGLLFFLGIFSVGIIFITKTIQLIGLRQSKHLTLGITVILVAALLERMQLPVIIPGIFGPHEFMHTIAGLSVWLLALFTTSDIKCLN